MNLRYRVELSQPERDKLGALLSGGRTAVRKVKRAQILLAADTGATDQVIAATLHVSGSTVYRTKRRFVEANLEGALNEEPRPGAERKLSGKEEALLVATACSEAPRGRARWTLDLLADELVRLTDHARSRARRYAAGWRRMISSPGARRCGASRRSMANTSPAWRTCSIFMLKRLIQCARSCASTRARSR